MDAKETLAAIRRDQPTNSPFRKWALTKAFGGALKQAGIDCRKLSCEEFEAEVERLLPQMHKPIPDVMRHGAAFMNAERKKS